MGIDRRRLKREVEIKMKERSGEGRGEKRLYPQCGLSVRKNFCRRKFVRFGSNCNRY